MEKLCIVKRRKTGFGGNGAANAAAVDDTAAPSPVLSFELTPQQASMIVENADFRRLCGETPSQVFFNLHFKSAFSAKMLTVANVCDMLQVSRTTVRKLVGTGAVPSVKIGRCRRFFMDDVLDYLTHSCGAPVSGCAKRLHAEVLITSGEQAQVLPN